MKTNIAALLALVFFGSSLVAQQQEIEAIAEPGGAIVIASSEDDGSGVTASSVRVMSMDAGDAMFFSDSLSSPMMFGGGDSFSMLSNPSVQKDLELVDEQMDRIKEINRDFGKKIKEQMGLMKDGSFDMSRAKELGEMISELKKQQKDEINNILLPGQQNRLQQVALQMQMRSMGTARALEHKLAEELGLSDEQLKKLKEKNKELQEEIRKKTAELKENAKKSLLKILTSDQREMLEDMTGKKFEPQSDDWRSRFPRINRRSRSDR